MGRQPGEFLSLPSLRDVIGFLAREFWKSVTQGGSGARRKKNHEVQGQRGKGMLTFLFLLREAFGVFLSHFSYRRIRIPQLVIWGIAGGMAGYFIITFCNYWPQPTYSLDLTGLVQTHPSELPSWDATEGQKADDVADLTGNIPPELYPELAYIVRDPILIANSGLPAEAWGDVLDNNSPSSIKPAASVLLEESAHEKPKVPLVKGIYHIVRSGENPWALAKLYGVSQEKIRDFNPALDPNRLMVGAKIFIPGAKEILAFTSNNQLIYPRKPAEIMSGYGYRRHPIGGNIRFHRGIDFRGRVGDPIYAVLDGVVEDVGNQMYGLGLVVVIRHDDGLETVYGHCSKILVKPGERVKQGDIISRVGQTGLCTGPHLHFGLMNPGDYQNPLPYLNGQKNITRAANIVRR